MMVEACNGQRGSFLAQVVPKMLEATMKVKMELKAMRCLQVLLVGVALFRFEVFSGQILEGHLGLGLVFF